MALPNDKISTTLVANTLGTNSRDVGTLCTHQAINKWSKWKPVRVNLNGNGATLSDLIGVNYGMTVKRISTLNFLPEMLQNTDYTRPNNASGYRIGDFRGYEHDHEPSFEVEYPTVLYSGGTSSQNAIVMRESGNVNLLHPSDIFKEAGISDMYIGYAMTNDQNNTIYLKTSQFPIGRGGNVLVPFNIYNPPSSNARATLTMFITDHRIGWRDEIDEKANSINNVLSLYPTIKFWSYMDDGTVRQKTDIAMSNGYAPQPPRPILWNINNETGWITVSPSYNFINVVVDAKNITSNTQPFEISKLRYAVNIRGTSLTDYERSVTLGIPTNVSLSNSNPIPPNGVVRVTFTMPIPNSINTPYVGEAFAMYRDVGASNEWQTIGATRVSYQQ